MGDDNKHYPIEIERNGYSVVSFSNRSADSQLQGVSRPFGGEAGQEDAFFEDTLRIQNSREWRRLQGIYQLDVGQSYEHENRLTHTIDVQNVSERIARKLNLDRQSIDLTRSIAAIHDIGHMPFGHWGERAAVAKLKPFGKEWTHDAAGLRVVTEWANYNGLNLTVDTLEGLAKRYWRYDDSKPASHLNHNTAELPDSIRDIDSKFDLHLGKQNHIEGQIAAISDWIAFTATDIEDGLRVGRMSLQEVCEHFPLAAEVYNDLDAKHGKKIGDEAEHYKVNMPKLLANGIKERLVDDVVGQLRTNIAREVAAGNLKNAEDARDLPQLLTGYSPEIQQGLRSFGKYCNEKPFKRTLETHGPLQQMAELTIDDIVSGKLQMPEAWGREAEKIRETGNTQDAQSALTELACTYMTCVMDDEGVKQNVRTNHPEFWSEHFADKPAPPRISPAFVSRVSSTPSVRSK
jgi:dGTPase